MWFQLFKFTFELLFGNTVSVTHMILLWFCSHLEPKVWDKKTKKQFLNLEIIKIDTLLYISNSYTSVAFFLKKLSGQHQKAHFGYSRQVIWTFLLKNNFRQEMAYHKTDVKIGPKSRHHFIPRVLLIIVPRNLSKTCENLCRKASMFTTCWHPMPWCSQCSWSN